MATQLQLRRDTAADLVAVPPAEGEPGYDQTNKRLLVGDGSRNEGIPHASFRDMHGQTFIAAVAGGTADALTLDLTDGTLDYNPSAYVKFQRFVFEAAAANTGAATLAVGGLAAKAVKKYHSVGAKAALAAGDIVDGNLYEATYDGTDFLLAGAALAGGAWQLLATATASSDAAIVFTGIGGAYARHVLDIAGLTVATDDAALFLRGSDDNGATFETTNSYGYFLRGLGPGTVEFDIQAASTSEAYLSGTGEGNAIGNAATEAFSGTIELFGLATLQRPHFLCRGVWRRSDGLLRTGFGGGEFLFAGVDALRLALSAGNIAAGDFKLYGVG